MGDGLGMCLRSGLLGTVERARSRARENGGGGGGGEEEKEEKVEEEDVGSRLTSNCPRPHIYDLRAAKVRTKEPIYRDGRARVHQGGGRVAVGEIRCADPYRSRI